MTENTKVLAAVLQMNSTEDVAANVASALALVEEAVLWGAELLAIRTKEDTGVVRTMVPLNLFPDTPRQEKDTVPGRCLRQGSHQRPVQRLTGCHSTLCPTQVVELLRQDQQLCPPKHRLLHQSKRGSNIGSNILCAVHLQDGGEHLGVFRHAVPPLSELQVNSYGMVRHHHPACAGETMGYPSHLPDPRCSPPLAFPLRPLRGQVGKFHPSRSAFHPRPTSLCLRRTAR